MTDQPTEPSATTATTDQPVTASPPSSAGTPQPSTPATPSPGETPKVDAPAPPAATPEGTTDGPKAGEDAPKEGDKPEGEKAEKARDASGKFAPDYSKLTFPEGFAPDEAALGKAKELFAKHKLPGDAAQEFAGFFAEQKLAEVQAYTAEWGEGGRLSQVVKDDPELGGPNFAGTMQLVAKGRDAFVSPGLAAVIEQFGIGNHPEMVRLFRDLGKAVAEDRLVTPGAPAARSDPYPNTPGMRP